ncbi:MAG: M4 family metallopeptidase, partial [Chitinophagales bacterium]
MNKYILSLLFIFSAYSSSFAQVFSGAEANELMPNAQKIWIAENAQTIKYIAFTQPEFVKTENHSDWLRSLMKGSDKVNFKLKNTTKDNLGQVHYRYDQYFMNYRVVGAQYILHTQNGKILSSNGDYVDTENVKLNSNFILKSEAEIIAKKSVLANEYAPKQSENLKKNEGQIVLLRIDNTLRFAYKIDVYATKPLARFYVYVDALSKKVLKKENRIHDTSTDGTAETMYHGTQSIKTDSASANHFVLVDSVNKVFTKNIQNTTNINAATNFVNNSNYWNNTTNNDNAAHDAHWGSTKTLEYFLTRFGLNSYDGNGTSLNSYIHYDNNYNNAFWDGASIFFGDGDNVKYSPLTSIDVVAHEITHAITENSADLVYNSESGALNESFSDIFGTALEFAVSPNSANWNMGDLFDLNGNGGFRNISDPKSKGDPDTYKRINWHTGSSDNYGVHTNSGVQNYWFYLLTEGGTGINDYLNNYDVVGIGMNDATSIAYRNLSVYLTYNSQYADAQFYAIQAAIDLFGICSQQVKSTRDAWYAVGLGSAPNNNVYSQFEVLQTNYCSSTATVSFINNSINDTARTWYFGDGNTSTALNPTHTYSSTGIYDVMLVSYGSSNCGTEIDSFSISNFINVTNNSAPIPAYCTPIDTGSTSFSSILNFTFNTINNNSVASKKIYEDYTCGHQTTVTEGEFINLELLATNEYKNVSVYIDYNNDGIFSNNEKIFSDASWGNYYQENIQIQNAAVLNTVLRLRVVLSRSYNDSTCIFGNATHYKRSQVEDYGITILPISSKPEISFYAQDTIIPLGSSVGFINESTGLPSFFWNFINGFPNTSNDTIPNILYNTLGLHNVELIATNSFGADTLLKTDYIEVVNDYRMCDTTNIEDLSGILYDDGGPLGNYSSSICTFVIEPPCADSIILSFLEFDMKSNSGLFQDDVSVYDGVNLIYRASRDDLPPEAIATSGRMIIVIDGTGAFYGSDDGFVARWRTIQQTQTIPVADFSFSNNNPAINEVVTFTDLSTENPSSWEWIFNNTDTVKTQNPEYSFSTAGINTIQLIASTCGFSDTIIKTITVQGEPNILVNPSPFNYTFNNCIESEIIPFTLYNTGLGELSVDSISFRKQVNTDFKVDYNASPYSSSNFFISPNNIDTILLTIEIIGDYDQVDEYASLEIDGIDYGIIPDYGSNTTYQIKLFGAALANYLTNSVLEVIVTNSPTVSGTPYHKVSIQYNAANEFISVQNIDTTITANDSVNFDITLSTQNMLLGNYLDSILIYSNDIDNSPLSLPISVINNGSAMLSLDKFCIDFDSVFRYGNNILPLSLHNSGCDTLFITNVYTNTSQFQDYDSIITILPFQYYDLEVNFSTNSIGSFLDTLYIESNVLDTSICLSAISIEGPSIEINPDSIYLSITECNDSLIVPITILNNGASTLNLNIENKDSILDVFLWDLNTHQQTTTRTILAINSYFTDYNLLQSSASDSLSFKNLLDGSDVLLIPNRTSYNSFDPVIYDYIKDFVSKGGWLVFAGSNSAYISSFDMISSYTSSSSNFYGIHTVDDPSSTLLSGVDFPLSASNATAYPLISAFPNFRAITSTSGNPLIGELDYNFGKVIYLGCTYGNASLNENSKKIIANSLRWASSSLLNWSSSSLSNASVISNDSLIFNYNFNTTNKVAGQYFSSIDLTSNDPTTPIIQIPVVIDIVAEPQMSFSTNCFNFDSIQSNSTTNYILWIYNEACDTLEISNIVSTDASVSSDSSLIVYPFDSTSLNLTFSPTLNQQYNGDLLFTSNAGDSLVCFSGYAGVAPVYFCDEDSIVVNALCHELFSYPLVIYNNGGSPLNINLLNSLDLTSGNNSDFVSLSTSDSISIPIGDSLIVYVNFDSDSLENGVYDFHYNLKTNDSLVTDTNIYFSYIVNGSPEILFTNYCVDFDTIIQFSDNNYQTILISNPGCDTLIVSDIVSSNDFAYQVDTSFVLLPYSSDSFVIKMSCDNLGMNYDTLTYFTNADADTSICISSLVIETPQISSDTDTLNVVLNSCNDTTDIQFKLYNTGITDLE